MTDTERLARSLLSKAGVEVDGPNPWDMQVHNPAFYARVLNNGSLGLGEAYMDGWWTCKDIAEFTNRILSADLPQFVKHSPLAWWIILRSMISNPQSMARAFMVGEQHYDHPDALYDAMLDPTRAYTCAYWKDAKTLEEAQVAKYDLVCKKLYLKPGEKVVDIGPGWGGLMRHAAKNYGASCVGYSVSKEQTAWGREHSKDLPVEFVLEDYRKLAGSFDKAMSVGMFEAVGKKNFRTFFEVIRKSLKDDGLFVLHTIWTQKKRPTVDAFIDKYIFPNGETPTLEDLFGASAELFDALDLQSFGPYYDKTLLAWNENFQKKRSELVKTLGERFCRMWEYYLLTCAGAFRSGDITVGQVVFAPHRKQKTAYQAVR